MKRRYFIALLIGIALWLTETAAYGWNAKPATAGEQTLDYISLMIILYGLIGDMISNVEIHKNYYKYKETNIKAKTVEIKGESPTVNNIFGTNEDDTRRLLTVKAAHEKEQK